MQVQVRLGEVVDVYGLFTRHAVIRIGSSQVVVKTRRLNIGDSVRVTRDEFGNLDVQKILPPERGDR